MIIVSKELIVFLKKPSGFFLSYEQVILNLIIRSGDLFKPTIINVYHTHYRMGGLGKVEKGSEINIVWMYYELCLDLKREYLKKRLPLFSSTTMEEMF